MARHPAWHDTHEGLCTPAYAPGLCTRLYAPGFLHPGFKPGFMQRLIDSLGKGISSE
eukprot:COSAG01_NODE_496_length_16290_cov_48.639244_18_plen_57_part_00